MTKVIKSAIQLQIRLRNNQRYQAKGCYPVLIRELQDEDPKLLDVS